MARARDNQRSKFYKVHDFLGEFSSPLDQKEIVKIVENMRTRVFLSSRYPEIVAPIGVEFTSQRALATRKVISLPKENLHNEVVLGIARLIANRQDQWSEWAWFGWEFCAIYLDVVRCLMGVATHDILKQRMKSRRVRFAPKKSRAV